GVAVSWHFSCEASLGPWFVLLVAGPLLLPTVGTAKRGLTRYFLNYHYTMTGPGFNGTFVACLPWQEDGVSLEEPTPRSFSWWVARRTMALVLQSQLNDSLIEVAPGPRFLVGRSRSADLVLRAAKMPPRAALFMRYPAGWAIHPLPAATPLLLNGTPLKQWRFLAAGDELSIGGCPLAVRAADRAPDTPAQPRRIDTLIIPCRLLLRAGAFFRREHDVRS